MRRKKNYRRTIDSLLRDLERLKERQQELTSQGKGDELIQSAIGEMAQRLKYSFENEEDEDARQL